MILDSISGKHSLDFNESFLTVCPPTKSIEQAILMASSSNHYYPPSFVLYTAKNGKGFLNHCKSLAHQADEDSKSPFDRKKELDELADALHHELKIVSGEIGAGNSSPDLREEGKQYVEELWEIGGLTEQQYEQWMELLHRPVASSSRRGTKTTGSTKSLNKTRTPNPRRSFGL
jgi:hypothetical protein